MQVCVVKNKARLNDRKLRRGYDLKQCISRGKNQEHLLTKKK